MVELILQHTTGSEVLEKLPQAEVVTAVESGQQGTVHVVFSDLEEDEARRLAREAGFSVVEESE